MNYGGGGGGGVPDNQQQQQQQQYMMQQHRMQQQQQQQQQNQSRMQQMQGQPPQQMGPGPGMMPGPGPGQSGGMMPRPRYQQPSQMPQQVPPGQSTMQAMMSVSGSGGMSMQQPPMAYGQPTPTQNMPGQQKIDMHAFMSQLSPELQNQIRQEPTEELKKQMLLKIFNMTRDRRFQQIHQQQQMQQQQQQQQQLGMGQQQPQGGMPSQLMPNTGMMQPQGQPRHPSPQPQQQMQHLPPGPGYMTQQQSNQTQMMMPGQPPPQQQPPMHPGMQRMPMPSAGTHPMYQNQTNMDPMVMQGMNYSNSPQSQQPIMMMPAQHQQAGNVTGQAGMMMAGQYAMMNPQQNQIQRQPSFGTIQMPQVPTPQPPSIHVPLQQQTSGPGTPSSIREGGTGIPSVNSGDGAPTATNAAAGADDAAYIAKLEQLKRYKEPLELLLERNRIDGIANKSTFDRFLEVVKGQRKVEEKLLDKLLINSEKIFKKLGQPLMEAVTSMVNQKETFKPFPDPWASVAQFAIRLALRDYSVLYHRVPDDLRAIADAPSDDDETEEPAAKKIRLATEANNVTEAESAPVKNTSGWKMVVLCENRDLIHLSPEASRELRTFKHRFDPEQLPLTGQCKVVEVLIESEQMYISPLRLAVPVDYPVHPARLVQDANVGEADEQLRSLLDRRMRLLSGTRTIADLVAAWKSALEQLASVDGIEVRWQRVNSDQKTT